MLPYFQIMSKEGSRNSLASLTSLAESRLSFGEAGKA
jgi:hypothetical protein